MQLDRAHEPVSDVYGQPSPVHPTNSLRYGTVPETRLLRSDAGRQSESQDGDQVLGANQIQHARDPFVRKLLLSRGGSLSCIRYRRFIILCRGVSSWRPSLKQDWTPIGRVEYLGPPQPGPSPGSVQKSADFQLFRKLWPFCRLQFATQPCAENIDLLLHRFGLASAD